LFCEIYNEKESIISGQTVKIYSAKKINKHRNFYIVNKDNFYAHGEDLKTAFEDLEFKIVSETLKNEPINKDTMITTKHYRLITGACELGVKQWLESVGITQSEIRADELLPILEKSNAYGLQKFKSLITF